MTRPATAKSPNRTLREALAGVKPREAYFDLLVGDVDWVALSAAVQAAELQLEGVERIPPARREAARKAAQKALDEARAAYLPHVHRAWFDPTPDYEALSIKYRTRGELIPILLEKCARDSDLTSAEWSDAVKDWPAADRADLFNTVLYLNIERTIPDLGKGFAPTL